MDNIQDAKKEKQNPLFRKTSLERISSPEELHDYMRVTSPRLWMLLSVVIALLIGFIVYASTARMENTMPVSVQVDTYTVADTDGTQFSGRTVYADLEISYLETLKPGMKLRVAGEEGEINSLYTSADRLGVLFSMNNEHFALPDGTYEAEIVLESVTPISFLLN